MDVSVDACRNMVLETYPREYPKKFRVGPIYAGGNPKGALPPLCRRGGGVHRGGTPSKGSLPYACFCLLFPRGKSRSGYGGETPGGRQIEWQQFGKRNVSLPPTPRYANQPCIGQTRWHSAIKPGYGAGGPEKEAPPRSAAAPPVKRDAVTATAWTRRSPDRCAQWPRQTWGPRSGT